MTQQVVAQLIDSPLDYPKLEKLATSIGFSRSDIKAALAAVNFLLDSATRYDVERSVLGIETEQLGLPQETSTTLLDIYFENKEKIEENYRAKEFKLAPVGKIDWRVDYILGSSVANDSLAPNIQLQINGGSVQEGSQFEIGAEKFRALLSELKTAHRMMTNLDD